MYIHKYIHTLSLTLSQFTYIYMYIHIYIHTLFLNFSFLSRLWCIFPFSILGSVCFTHTLFSTLHIPKDEKGKRSSSFHCCHFVSNIYIYTHSYMYMYIHIYTYIHSYNHMYIHIFTHTHAYPKLRKEKEVVLCTAATSSPRYIYIYIHIFTCISTSARKASSNKAGVELIDYYRPRFTQNRFSGTNPKCRFCSREWYKLNKRGA